MSIVDAVNRIQQIESQLVQLSDPVSRSVPASATAGTAASSASGSASGTAFATTLAAATGTKVSPAAGQLAANGTTGADVVADARKYLGVPYVFGGTTSAGLDCSGLVQRVYGDLGISLPRLVSGQSTIGESVPSLADAQPGDLIVCNGGEHIVIYAGNGKIIQAPKPGGQVEEMDNWISPSNVVTIRRIVPTAAGPGSGVAGSGPAGSDSAAILAALAATGESSGLTSLLGSGNASSLAELLGAGGAASLTGLLGSGGTSSLAGLLGSNGTSGTTGNNGLMALLSQLGSGGIA